EELPGLRLHHDACAYLDRSRPGNAFCGIIERKNGLIYLFPLQPSPTSEWATRYKGKIGTLLEQNQPIRHELARSSHGQLACLWENLLERNDKEGFGQSGYLGFTVNDLRGVDDAVHWSQRYAHAALTGFAAQVIRVTSLSLNQQVIRQQR